MTAGDRSQARRTLGCRFSSRICWKAFRAWLKSNQGGIEPYYDILLPTVPLWLKNLCAPKTTLRRSAALRHFFFGRTLWHWKCMTAVPQCANPCSSCTLTCCVAGFVLSFLKSSCIAPCCVVLGSSWGEIRRSQHPPNRFKLISTAVLIPK